MTTFLYTASESKLAAYNTSTHTMEELFDLPEVKVRVRATEKDLGLVCVSSTSAPGPLFMVGNPALGNSSWKTVSFQKPREINALVGIALRHKVENFFAYRLFAFFCSEDMFIQIDVFDSESGLWASKEPWRLSGGDRANLFSADGSQAYIASDFYDHQDSSHRFFVTMYDMDSDKRSMVSTAAKIERDVWDSFSNHSDICPTLVVCQESLYVIGRTGCHRYLRVWKLVLDTMVCIADYAYKANNKTILFASNGKNKIYARSPDHIIEYDIVNNEWTRVAGPGYISGLSDYEGSQKMVSGSLQLPSKPLLAKHLEITGQPTDNSYITYIWLFRRDSTVRSLKIPGYICPSAATVLSETGLICAARAGPSFPDTIYIGNTATCSWEEIGNIPLESIADRDRFANNQYDPLEYEFIGLSMKQQQQQPQEASGYFVYYFYLETGKLAEGSTVHVLRYDSITRSWDQPAEPCRVDARSYGWLCSVSGGSSSFKNKIYLSSIRFYRSTSDEQQRLLPDISGPKRYRSLNKMRVIAYDTVNNVWDNAVLQIPKAGVCPPCDPDPLNSNVNCSLVICKGKWFVVGRGDGDDRNDTLGIWEIREGGEAEIVTMVKARAWGGSILLATDGFNKIFVTVVERESHAPVGETSRVMEYDLENGQWTCYPFENCYVCSFIAE